MQDVNMHTKMMSMVTKPITKIMGSNEASISFGAAVVLDLAVVLGAGVVVGMRLADGLRIHLLSDDGLKNLSRQPWHTLRPYAFFTQRALRSSHWIVRLHS